MRRPLPHIPHGPRQKRANRPTRLLACPRISPEWELAALSILMKPKEWTKGKIKHRPAEQPWSAKHAALAESTRAVIVERLEFDIPLIYPAEGDYWLLAEIPELNLEEAKAFAVLLSKKLPAHWFVLDRLFVHKGRFFRRERGFKLNLVEATNVHLTRGIRAAIGLNLQLPP